MSERTHSQWPWEAFEFCGEFYVKSADDEKLAALWSQSDQALIDAKLMAAAPELLAALIAAVESGMVPVSSAKEAGAAKYSRQVHVADMIRAAIAKATGCAS